jgi:hypothetical protein
VERKTREKIMSDAMQKWRDYKPTKATWLWSCVGAAVLTIIVGFSWGGWVTGGTAQETAENSAEAAVAGLAAKICAFRFLQAPDAGERLAALKDASSWERNSLIEDAGWATFAKMEEPVDGAADLCAQTLASAELPVAQADSAADRKIDIVKQ